MDLEQDAREVIQALREKSKVGVKANITFRLPVTLINSFKAGCKKNNIGPNAVIEELVRRFTNGLSK